MTYSLRRLDPATDSALFAETYRWLMEGPEWRRETEEVFGTLNEAEFLRGPFAPGRCDIGIWDDTKFIANVVLTLRAQNVYEVHFDARRGANSKVVIAAGLDIRNRMFGVYGAQYAYTWTPHWNRGVLQINKALEFLPDNVTMLRGTCRGRVIEWVRCGYKETV